ncbi:MAG: HAMP domain-containing histidine kinase [Gammaproteobacteria bacterium]|nr:MAG: HAMP domain-containing histidine kinase [Gammaproteobacteria bacterium]
MSPSANSNRAAPAYHLTQLTLIRSILLGFLWLCFALSSWFSTTQMPHKAVLILLVIFTSIHGLTYLRLKKLLVVTEWEFFYQLLIDVICLNTLFYFSGGANNPFISYLLVPICISAATLPWRFTWVITSLCLLTYTLLLFFHVDLPIFKINHHEPTLSWHILGMWFNFFISAILVTYFVVKMARTLREQDTVLNNLREDELRNEQLMAVATLAAGAAHEINTPLSTMTVLLSEMRADSSNNKNLIADLELLSTQVNQCASILKKIVHDSSAAINGHFKQIPVKEFCNQIIDRWQLLRPGVSFNYSFGENISEHEIATDPRIEQAIINLLNNAADANPNGYVKIAIEVIDNLLIWRIADEGRGIDSNIQDVLGKNVVSTKENGLGLGMLLSNATLKYYGGSVTQIANPPKGTLTELRLPL